MPKICGNTRYPHLTALLAASLGIACGESPGGEQFREIRAHWLPGCGPGADAFTARIDLQALGDFDPSADTYEQFDADVVGEISVFPASTRAVFAKATARDGTWTGVASAGEAGDVDIGLWPESGGCVLFGGERGRYPDTGDGAAVGYAASTATLLVSGGRAESATSAMTVDVATGNVHEVAAKDGPRTARSFATVTPFGPDLLVAGGVDPDSTVPLDSADVFRAAAGRFDPKRLALSRPRTRHAAVQLRSGETLLVGGSDDNGGALRTLETVSPVTGEYRISGLTRLAGGRVDPIALRLSDDSVLIAGGLDAAGDPVALLEWLDPAAATVTRASTALDALAPPTRGRAFVAMPGGGALAAGGCVLRLPAAAEAEACARDCGDGGGCASSDVFWILPNGEVTRLEDGLDVGASHPALVEGAGGRPWLVAGPPQAPVVRVFDPFAGRFDTHRAVAVPPSEAAAFRFVPVDAGLFVWLGFGGDAASIGGFRHGTRGPYTTTVDPLLRRDTEGVSPDRPLAGAPDGSGVTLSDTEARLVLTDATYAALRLVLDVASGPPPVVYLGARAYGEDDCEWPERDAGGLATLARTESAVRLEHGGRSRECSPPDGRVVVSLRATEELTLSSLTIQRSPQ